VPPALSFYVELTFDYVLGPPDFEKGPISHTPKDKQTYGVGDIHRQITYTRLWNSMDAIVQELEDGKLQIMYGGKYIGQSSRRDDVESPSQPDNPNEEKRNPG